MIGLFIQAIVNFLIVALTIFVVVKLITRMKKKRRGGSCRFSCTNHRRGASDGDQRPAEGKNRKDP